MSAHADEDDRATATHRFDDVGYWKKVFDDPKRDAWQKPAELVAALQIPAGATVADLGAGTGYFARYLSQAVGPTGAVLAVEVEPTLIAHLRDRAEREQLANVAPLFASARQPAPAAGERRPHSHRRYLPPPRPPPRVSAAAAPRAAPRRAHRRRRLEARRAPEGPAARAQAARARQVIDEMRDAGFALVGEPDILPYHYVLIFTER